MPKQRPYDQECPIARTMDIIGDRWTMLVLRDLFFGKTRFNELLRSSPGLPPKVLSQRLQKLEEHRLIERTVTDGRPPRTEYAITSRGRSLAPVLQMIAQWGLENLYADKPEVRKHIEEAVYSTVPRMIPEGVSLKATDD